MSIKKRKINGMRKPNRRKPINAKKVTIDGIEFDSTMEGNMYRFLKLSGIKFKYIGKENAKYEVSPESTYKGDCYERAQRRSKSLRNFKKIAKAGYTPDFIGENEEWFIEVKGRKLGDFPLKWKMFKLKLNKRKKVPLLFMPVTKKDCEEVVTLLKTYGYSKTTKGINGTDDLI